jgi:hypothetical protein
VAIKTFLDRVAHHFLFRAQSHPNLTDRWGYHIRPIHYYEPLPDFRSITLDQITRRRAYPGIDFRWKNQLAHLNELTAYHLLEAFLSFNEKFQITLANYWLCLDHAHDAARLWPNALSANYGASSLWMKRIA